MRREGHMSAEIGAGSMQLGAGSWAGSCDSSSNSHDNLSLRQKAIVLHGFLHFFPILFSRQLQRGSQLK